MDNVKVWFGKIMKNVKETAAQTVTIICRVYVRTTQISGGFKFEFLIRS